MPEDQPASYSVETVAMSILSAGLDTYEQTGDMDAARAVIHHHRDEMLPKLSAGQILALDWKLIDLLLNYYLTDET